MKGYEVTYIIDPGVSEENVPKVVDKYSEYVTKNEGQVVNIDNWGKRKLAYEIKGRTEGVYITMKFNSSAKATHELKRIMGIDEEIVRNVVLRIN